MMSESTSPVSKTLTLTPSETVLLHADRFAPKDTALTVGEELLLREGKVAVGPLAQALLATALLVNEQQGVLRLEIQVKPALFGLLKRRHLIAVPLSRVSQWPDGTLEASVHRQLGGSERNVGDLVYEMLETDSSRPTQIVPALVKRGLVGRGLLESKTSKTLKVFTTSTWVSTPELHSLASAQSTEAERELLRACETGRPEVWAALNKSIAGAISRRTESTDYDPD